MTIPKKRQWAIAVSITIFFIGYASAFSEDKRHGLSMFGSLRYDADFKHFDYVNPKAPQGGRLKLSTVGGFDSLNGFIIKGTPAAGLGLMYDTLMRSSEDEPFSMYGYLAESMEMPSDRRHIIFNLHPSARWHDGAPVTAEDVVFTFNLLREKGVPLYNIYYADVMEVRAEGTHRVFFDLGDGSNSELPLILGQLPVLPMHYWQDRDFEKTILEPPLGSGPYRISRVDPNRSIVYEKVEGYWGADLPVLRGYYNFSEIVYDYYRDDSVRFEAFKAGEFDIRLENTAKNWALGYDLDSVRDGRLKRGAFLHKRAATAQGFYYNTRRFIFSDPLVREALGYVFDFEWLNKNIFYGLYHRTRSYFGNTDMESLSLPVGDELAILKEFKGQMPSRILEESFTLPQTTGNGDIRNNLRYADRLLKEAGWKMEDGRRVHLETGTPLSFEILLVQPAIERIALPFVKNLERLGIQASVRTVDVAQYLRRRDQFDFDMISHIFLNSETPGNEQYEYWGSEAALTEGGRNIAGVSDPVVDALIGKLLAVKSREELNSYARALDRVLLWSFYWIPHYHAREDRLAWWDKFGMPEITPDRGVDYMNWWTKE